MNRRKSTFPFQIRIDQHLRVDEKLAKSIREQAFAADRRVGWEIIRLLKAGLAAKSVPAHIGWGYYKLSVTMHLPVEHIDERTKRRIRARAIRNDRTMSGEIVHLLKAAIIEQQLVAGVMPADDPRYKRGGSMKEPPRDGRSGCIFSKRSKTLQPRTSPESEARQDRNVSVPEVALQKVAR